jgi:hypothetical protein
MDTRRSPSFTRIPSRRIEDFETDRWPLRSKPNADNASTELVELLRDWNDHKHFLKLPYTNCIVRPAFPPSGAVFWNVVDPSFYLGSHTLDPIQITIGPMLRRVSISLCEFDYITGTDDVLFYLQRISRATTTLTTQYLTALDYFGWYFQNGESQSSNKPWDLKNLPDSQPSKTMIPQFWVNANTFAITGDEIGIAWSVAILEAAEVYHDVTNRAIESAHMIRPFPLEDFCPLFSWTRTQHLAGGLSFGRGLFNSR